MKFRYIAFGLLVFLLVFFTSCEEAQTSALTETINQGSESETKPPEKTVIFVTDSETEDPYNSILVPTEYEEVPKPEYGLSENEAKRTCAFELSGTVQTATGTSLNLIVEWKAVREEGEDFCVFTADIAVEHKAIHSPNFIGSFSVDGNESVFMSPYYEYSHNDLTREWLCPIEVKIPCGYGEDKDVYIKANWSYSGTYEGDVFSSVTLDAKVPIGEKYAALKPSVSYDVGVILQKPELPEGCEVTSLAILLNYLGYDISHTELSDNFLETGEVGKVSYYDVNIGNPRYSGTSWGCYSPVIVKTANKYLASVSSHKRAFSYTGYDISEIYYQLSMGNPVIVWVTIGYVEPFTQNSWNVNGRKLYWKYPLHCVVLSGYDKNAGTVTVTDPLNSKPVTVDMSKFELRFRQMEAQAVVIKDSRLSTAEQKTEQ